MAENKVIIKTVNLQKSFKVGDQMVPVLKGVDIEINRGELVVLFGPSGCGKSTLLHTILGLEEPTDGKVFLDGSDFYQKTEDGRSIYRKHNIGIIYQQAIWVKALNVLDNISFPLRLLGVSPEEAEIRSHQALKLVGMERWEKYLPSELSAGQQQKVSLARAIIINPIFIAADEPTGNLDTTSGNELIRMFMNLNDQGKTILMITHDLSYLKSATKLIHLIDGKVVGASRAPKDKTFISKITDKKSTNGQESYEANVRDPNFLTNLFNLNNEKPIEDVSDNLYEKN